MFEEYLILNMFLKKASTTKGKVISPKTIASNEEFKGPREMGVSSKGKQRNRFSIDYLLDLEPKDKMQTRAISDINHNTEIKTKPVLDYVRRHFECCQEDDERSVSPCSTSLTHLEKPTGRMETIGTSFVRCFLFYLFRSFNNCIYPIDFVYIWVE